VLCNDWRWACLRLSNLVHIVVITFIEAQYIKMMRYIRMCVVILTATSVIQGQPTLEQTDNKLYYEEWNTLANELSLVRTKLEAIAEILSLNVAGWCAVDYSTLQFQIFILKARHQIEISHRDVFLDSSSCAIFLSKSLTCYGTPSDTILSTSSNFTIIF